MRSKSYVIKIDGEFKEAFNCLSRANHYLKSYKDVHDVDFTYEIVSEVTVSKVVRNGNRDSISAYDKIKD